MPRSIYFECRTGISGDMAVASMLDLGADEAGLRAALSELSLDGFHISSEEYMNRGIRTRRFSVHLTHASDPGEYPYGDPADIRGDSLAHEDEHMHDHEHHHEHRNLADVEEILSRLSDPRVRDLASRIFRIVAEAESRVHNQPLDRVHFHEVGALDSIADIVAAAFCIVNLDIGECLLTSVSEGCGTVQCAHGILPVPVPATSAIAEAYHLPLTFTKREGEMVTPTGAAILAALWKGKTLPESFQIEKIGYASGHRDYPEISILRSMLIKENNDGDSIYKLETNIDDASAESLGYTLECLMAQGARDAYFTPVYMKKNRPAYLLSVLCDKSRIDDMEEIIFRNTTTIGIRRYAVQRDVLDRTIKEVTTPYGTARLKCVSRGSLQRAYPEYESVRAIAKEGDLGFQDAYQLILDAFGKGQDK